MALENAYPPIHFPSGRPLKYTPAQIQDKFVEYVQWCKDNPIRIGTETIGTTTDGRTYGTDTKEDKPRLVSVSGFLVFIGASWVWWKQLDQSKTDFSKVKDFIRAYCEDYQKEMASAGIFNGNIISRLLGLSEKHEVEASGPINVSLVSEKAAEGLKAALASGAAPRKPQNE